MPIFHKLRGTRENSFSVGDGSAGLKTISFLTDDSNKPGLRWNPSPGRLEFLDTHAVSYAVPRVREEIRSLPTSVGRYIELGSFTFSLGVFSFHIAVFGSNGTDTITKEYFLSVAEREIAYTTVSPGIDTGAVGGNDFALELGASSGTLTLRLRRTAGTSALSALTRILVLGADTAAYSTASGTGVSAASGTYDVAMTAAGISYDDTLVAPPLDAANVQDAIDALKSSSGGTWGLVPFSMTGMGSGDFGYVSGRSALSKTDAAVEAHAVFAGANVGVIGKALVCGLVPNANFSAVSATPVCGNRVFLARADDEGGGAAAGKLTVSAPTSGFIAEVGVVADVDPVTYPSTKTASVLLQPKAIVARA